MWGMLTMTGTVYNEDGLSAAGSMATVDGDERSGTNK